MTNSLMNPTEASSSATETSAEMLICTANQMTNLVKRMNAPQKTSEGDPHAMDTQDTIIVEDDALETRELIHAEKSTAIIHIDDYDPHGPTQVGRKVKMVTNKWGPVEPINPERFFLKMLLSRGYETKMIPALTSQNRRSPSAKQMKDYDNDLVHAIKNNDLAKVKNLHVSGRSMSACNRFSESVVHIACRRASFEVADYVLSNGGDCNIVDDYGRTPLHDACWRMEPRFDVVTLLLDKNLDLLRTLDVRGSTPLKYVREEHWIQWCAYIFHQKDKYWLPVGDPSENNKRLRSFE